MCVWTLPGLLSPYRSEKATGTWQLFKIFGPDSEPPIPG